MSATNADDDRARLLCGDGSTYEVPFEADIEDPATSRATKVDAETKIRTRGAPLSRPRNIEEEINAVGLGWFQIRLLVIFGILVAGDGMEMVVISLLYPALRDQWNLTTSEESFLASSVFAGFLLGCLVGGRLGDSIGRRRTFLVSGCVFLVASICSGFAPNFLSLCTFRFLVGFAVGGKGPSAMAVLMELTPTRHRGCIGLLEVGLSFSLGEAFACWACMAIPQDLAVVAWWRAVFLSCALPVVLALPLAYIFAPESPHYLSLRGRHEDVDNLLSRMAAVNLAGPDCCLCRAWIQWAASGWRPRDRRMPVRETDEIAVDVRPPPEAESPDPSPHWGCECCTADDGLCERLPGPTPQLLPPGEGMDGEELQEATSVGRGLWGTRASSEVRVRAETSAWRALMSTRESRTALICVPPMWAVCSMAYYGHVFVYPLVLEAKFNMQPGDRFVAVLLAAAAELPGLAVAASLVDLKGVGRRYSTLGFYFVGAVTAILVKASPNSFISILELMDDLFDFPLLTGAEQAPFATREWVFQLVNMFIKTIINACFCILWVVSAELFPTSARATGVAICSGAARVTGVITPPAFVWALGSSVSTAYMLLAGILGIGTLISVFYNFETVGKSLEAPGHQGPVAVPRHNSRALPEIKGHSPRDRIQVNDDGVSSS